MEAAQNTFFCIDMKTFYASVECAERGLNPFETCLVVADETRGANALCLAVTPQMKAKGVRNRCRLSEIPKSIQYMIVPPRMQLYLDYSADIYALYLDYFAPEDIHVYSVDECFIDATPYLRLYRTEGIPLAKKLMREISQRLQIPSTAGVGTNLYLAKIALDITAKKAPDHLGYLNEERYRELLWDHRPITDFWGIARGTANRLMHLGIDTQRGIANAPEQSLYKAFGINAEILIEHAWGRESCRMEDIKQYRTKSHSVSFSQILPRDYTWEEAAVVMTEMTLNGCLELYKRHVITKKVWIGIGYSREAIPASQASIRLPDATQRSSVILPPVEEKFREICARTVPVRRLMISFADTQDEGCQGYDLFTDAEKAEREKTLERAVLGLRAKYGKNAVLRGINLNEAGTQRERNEMIGGHRAGTHAETAARKTIHAV